MKDFLKKLWDFLINEIDGKDIVYKLYFQVIEPKLKELVVDTESKWDDRALDSLSYLVEVFFKKEKEEKNPEIVQPEDC